jgi:hypothetical protein
MPNDHVLQRLAGIQKILRGVREAGASMSASSRGIEREAFVNDFLAQVLPPIFRFGTGDATDASGLHSGQLDVVIEYPFAPSLPLVSGGSAARLYLPEGIAAVIEVKSDVSNQWAEAQRTAAKLAPLRRSTRPVMTVAQISDNVPLFVAGYTWWRKIETVKRKLDLCPDIAGVLVIDRGLFVTQADEDFTTAKGPWALWGLICTLHYITNALQAAAPQPWAYAV